MEIAETSPSALIRATCHTTDCDQSWERWYIGTPDKATDAAEHDLTHDEDWAKEDDHYYCPDCAITRVCEAEGHQWQAYRRCDTTQVRADQCGRCHEIQLLALPGGTR